MPEIYQARNVQEAVEMAEGFKDAGRYDWFRGQVRDWPPRSSLVRLLARADSDEIEHNSQRLTMFFRWLEGCAEFEPFRDFQQERNVHTIFAVLQHYGICTHYVDFSTEPGVAGFFAADTKKPEEGATSCIYCLNTADLTEVWDVMRDLEERKGAELEIVSVDVNSLWRLESQRGVFLYVNYNWDVDYPMDRILFPYTGYPAFPTRETIYPPQKSPLEAVLDRYFELEQTTFANRALRKVVQAIEKAGARKIWHDMNVLPDSYYAPAFAGGKLDPLASWAPDQLVGWSRMKEETMRDAAAPQISLQVKPAPGASDLREAVRYGLRRLLRSDKAARTKMFTFRLDGIAEADEGRQICDRVATTWNGMRRLPFSDDDIAEACGSVAGLHKVSFHNLDRPQRSKAFSDLFGDSFEVGFANDDNSSSIGFAARTSLQQALRPDMAQLLVDEHRARAGDCRELFRVAYSPQRMFEFPVFVRLFAREVIPAQVLTRSFVIYSPAKLMTFGLP